MWTTVWEDEIQKESPRCWIPHGWPSWMIEWVLMDALMFRVSVCPDRKTPGSVSNTQHLSRFTLVHYKVISVIDKTIWGLIWKEFMMFMAVYIQHTESESVQKSTSTPPSALNTGWEFFIFIFIFFPQMALQSQIPNCFIDRKSVV